MTVASQIQTIPLSGSVSGGFNIGNARALTLHLPALTSCVLTLQSAIDTSSANYYPVVLATGSLYTIGVTTGSRAVILGPEVLGGSQHIRFSSSVAQAAVRSLTVMARL